MAKKIPLLGIVLVVGMMFFVIALGNGNFKNFSIADNSNSTATPTPSVMPTAHNPLDIAKSWLQPILNYLNSLWQQLVTFLKGYGINL